MTRTSRNRVAILGISAFLCVLGCGGADKEPGEYITGCADENGDALPTPAWAKDAYQAMMGTAALSVDGMAASLSSVPECRILLTTFSPFLKISPPGRPVKEPPPPPVGTCPAPTGDLYVVQFINERTPKKPAYEALVSGTEFRPDLALWRDGNGGRLAQTVFGKVIRGVFTEGKMTAGPFTGPETAFMLSSSGDCR